LIISPRFIIVNCYKATKGEHCHYHSFANAALLKLNQLVCVETESIWSAVDDGNYGLLFEACFNESNDGCVGENGVRLRLYQE
jgi:hypothetical protein